VSISIPCVAGPYTGLSSTLTLLTSKVRVKSAPANQSYTDDQNFRQSALPTRSIATSTGQNDSGMFELNFRDDRYLPFEGHGVIGTWRLSMPQKFRPFDYTTISDVLLHMRYTARDAGGVLKKAAQDAMVAAVNAIGAAQSGFNRLFSLNQEFPSEWSRFVGSGRESKVMEFALTKRRFPFLFTGKGLKVKISKVGLLAVPAAAASAPVDLPATLKLFSPTDVNALQSQSDLSIGPLQGKIFDAGRSVEVKEKDTDARWKLTLAAADVAAFADDVADVLLICGYTVENN
jgi:hypothetical protein